MTTEIKAFENGPYFIPGAFTYVDADGNEQTTPGKGIALCRCGQSANKPFCDGAHKNIGFEAAAISLQLNDE
ncbi:MAG: CDGSH iron-sulfur domain-containing protein [Chloroflexi bacterium]|nr:CDGSH iron-sulfur domain-containing protein [Chloroflexota bacterium]